MNDLILPHCPRITRICPIKYRDRQRRTVGCLRQAGEVIPSRHIKYRWWHILPVDEDSTSLKYGFTGNGGAVDPCIHRSCTCSETFGVFFADKLSDKIVQETNHFAEQRPLRQPDSTFRNLFLNLVDFILHLTQSLW